IGCGDTFASAIGFKFGRRKWPGSSKTYLGTAAAVLAQLIGGCIFWWYIGVELRLLLVLKLTVISVAISLLEAFTQQVDNLLLPLYFHLAWLSIELCTNV